MNDELEMLSALGLSKFVDPSDLVEKAIERRDNPIKGIALPWSKLSGVELPKDGVSLIGGYSGHQKSTLANQISLHAADSGHKVCMASLELTSDYLFSMLASQSACKGTDMHDDYLHRFGRWLDQRMFIVDHADTLTGDECIQMIIDSKRLLGCDLFVLDCLMMVDLGGELEQEKNFMAKVAAVARAYKIGVLIIHHCRKPGQGDGEAKVPTRDSLIGSSHLVNASSVVLMAWMDTKKAAAKQNDEEFDDSKPCYLVSVAKNRFSPFIGMAGLFQHPEARLLCNSRARRYLPINLEETCQLDEKHIGEYRSDSGLSTFPTKRTPDSTPKTEQLTQRTGTASPL